MTDTTETPMRERIARLYAKWARCDEGGSHAFEFADAVLDAMREPTTAMLIYSARDSDDTLEDWRAMIDAAKEGK